MRYNKRAIEMFEHIFPYVSWKYKTVADLGCGYGDMAYQALMNGAERVVAIDKDMSCLKDTLEKCQKFHIKGRLIPSNIRLEDLKDYIIWSCDKQGICPEIYFCFSVLPYLSQRDALNVLKTMRIYGDTSFIELQYMDDGPGNPFDVENDDQMLDFLTRDAQFGYVKPIGRTHIKDRDKYRTIWLCRQQGPPVIE